MNYKDLITRNKLAETFQYLRNSLLKIDQNQYNSLIGIINSWKKLKVDSIKNTASKEMLDVSHSKIVSQTLELIDHAKHVYANQKILIITTANNYHIVHSIAKELELYCFPFIVNIIKEEEVELTIVDHIVAILLTITDHKGELSFPEKVMYDLDIWGSDKKKSCI